MVEMMVFNHGFLWQAIIRSSKPLPIGSGSHDSVALFFPSFLGDRPNGWWGVSQLASCITWCRSLTTDVRTFVTNLKKTLVMCGVCFSSSIVFMFLFQKAFSWCQKQAKCLQFFLKSFFKANKKRCWISAISDQLEVMRLEAYWQAAQLQSRNGENCNTFPRTWINMGDKIWSLCITCFFLRWLKKTFTYINYIRITRWVEWFSCLSCGSCLSSWSGFCCSCLTPWKDPQKSVLCHGFLMRRSWMSIFFRIKTIQNPTIWSVLY